MFGRWYSFSGEYLKLFGHMVFWFKTKQPFQRNNQKSSTSGGESKISEACEFNEACERSATGSWASRFGRWFEGLSIWGAQTFFHESIESMSFLGVGVVSIKTGRGGKEELFCFVERGDMQGDCWWWDDEWRMMIDEWWMMMVILMLMMTLLLMMNEWRLWWWWWRLWWWWMMDDGWWMMVDEWWMMTDERQIVCLFACLLVCLFVCLFVCSFVCSFVRSFPLILSVFFDCLIVWLYGLIWLDLIWLVMIWFTNWLVGW